MPYQTQINFTDTYVAPVQGETTFVNPSGFKLLIDNMKYKNAQYFVQMAALPDVSTQGAPLAYKQRNVTTMPDKLEYAPLEVTFLVDEDMINYKEIHDWIVGLVTQHDRKIGQTTYNDRKTRDITLQILTSHNNVAQEITFIDAYPINISSLPFTTATTDVEYLTAAVTFQYSYYKFKK